MSIQLLVDESSKIHESLEEELRKDLPENPSYFELKTAEIVADIFEMLYADSRLAALDEAQFVFRKVIPIINYLVEPTSVNEFISKKYELLAFYYELSTLNYEFLSFYDIKDHSQLKMYILSWLRIITDTLGITNEYESTIVLKSIEEIDWLHQIIYNPEEPPISPDLKRIDFEKAQEACKKLRENNHSYTLVLGKFRWGCN